VKEKNTMNRTGNFISLIAVCAIAAFFTGCGEGDTTTSTGGGGNNTGAGNSPGTLSGQTYTLANSTGNNNNTVIAFGQNGTYTVTQGATTEQGTFTATRDGNLWNVTTVNNGGTMTSTLSLSFTGAGAGSYTFQQPAKPLATGSFSSGSNPGSTTTEPGTTTTEPGTTTTEPPTTTTTTGPPTTTTTTGPGPGTRPAPLTAPGSINVVTGAGTGVGENATYTIVLSGGNSGTFQITNSGSSGSGTYTYTPNGNDANLRLTYGGQFNGDFDNMTLLFTQPAGSAQPNNFTGNQRVQNVDYPFNGTFTY